MDRTTSMTLQTTMAVIGLVLFIASYAMAEPKRVITEEQTSTLADRQDGKNQVEKIKPSDIDSCATMDCLKPIMKKMLKRLRDIGGS